MNRATALLFLAGFITGCPTVSGPSRGARPIEASGLYVHGPSGFSFPESFGAFRRVEINQFDSSGMDVGVGYNLEQADSQIALTLYVYPRARDANGSILTLESQFEIERTYILQAHPGGKASETWTPTTTQNHEASPGYATTFRYQQLFAYRQQEIESLLYLFDYEGWAVKYRITYPLAQQAKANLVSQVFVSSFIWRGGS